MTVQEKPYPTVSRMVDVFGEWLKHRRELREMREMDAANLDQIASDLRMSSADLEALVRQGPHAADELPKMLAALGIDLEDLARTEPLVLRDMERVCSMCINKRQCDRDLAAGSAAAHYEEYCANAPTIDGLSQQP
jgi:transcriptional regulator with XRE-family HTH domain